MNGTVQDVEKWKFRVCSLAGLMTLLASGIFLSGCLTVDQEVVLKEDGSGSSFLRVCVDRETYLDESSRREYEPLIRMVFDDLDRSRGTTGHSRTEVDQQETHCYEGSHEFGNVNEFGGNSMRFSFVTENRQKVLRSTILLWDDLTQDQWVRFKGEDTAGSARLRFRFTLPYPVTEAIGGAINGAMAVWDVPLVRFADSPLRGTGMTARAAVGSISIEGNYRIEGGKSKIRLK